LPRVLSKDGGAGACGFDRHQRLGEFPTPSLDGFNGQRYTAFAGDGNFGFHEVFQVPVKKARTINAARF
jgi:hypothetical protein